MPVYYEAYDERYRIAHAAKIRWMGDAPSPIVLPTLEKYGVGRDAPILELGCGEGRDAIPLLERGYDLLATDVSPEAIRWCREKAPRFAGRFQVLDCVRGALAGRFAFIYAVAVLHMLVEDGDRGAFYRFIREHLAPGGCALIGTMGDGAREMRSDVTRAFALQQRESPAGPILVPATSCRVVNGESFARELASAGFTVAEQGFYADEPQFDRVMYAVVTEKTMP